MPSIECSNKNCEEILEYNLEDLEIEDSVPSGNHTTQYYGTGEITCSCGYTTEVSNTWDELNDTEEVLDID